MKLSNASRDMLKEIAAKGGAIECQGNLRQGNALERRGLVKAKGGRFHLTTKGKKFIEKN